MTAGLQLQDGDEVSRADQRFIFRALLGGEFAFICAPGECVDPLLDGRRNPQGDDTASGLGVKALAKRIEKAIEHWCGAHALTVPCNGDYLSLDARRLAQCRRPASSNRGDVVNLSFNG